jgi:hypothetical protein
MTEWTHQDKTDELVASANELNLPDALTALLEAQAKIMADNGVVPGTDAYASLMALHGELLPARVTVLRRQLLEAVH